MERMIAIPDSLKGVDFEPKPTDVVVVTGIGVRTPFGNFAETMLAREQGRSAVKPLTEQLARDDIHVTAPFSPDFDPYETLDLGKIKKWHSPVSALALLTAIEAATSAGILNEQGKLRDDIDPYRAGIYGYTGFGQALRLADLTEIVGRNLERIRNGTGERLENVKPSDPIQIFPEQTNARIAERLGLKGKGNTGVQACAGGGAAIADAVDTIKSGRNRIVIAGGYENLLTHPAVSLEAFASMGALSKSKLGRESRPFDQDRDGFVMGAGAGFLVLESRESAETRGARIYATIEGSDTAMDGRDVSISDPERVSAMLASVVLDRKTKKLKIPDVAYMHATSTPLGDRSELEALYRVYGTNIVNIPLVGPKASLGHSIAASAVEAVAEAIHALNEGIIAPTINLVNPGDIVRDPDNPNGTIVDYFNADLDIVTSPRLAYPQTALVMASGFGGNNAAIFLRR